MVHASLRAIGPVEGRADGVISALQEAVGPTGTLMMILGAELDWFTVDDAPTETVAELLRVTSPFDAKTSPALKDVGYLAEAFRRREGVIVTNHPDGRFAAWGARAHELLDDAPWDDYYGPDSPLDRFCRARGRVLRMGADLNTVTALHWAEYLADVPNKRRRTLYFLMPGSDGPEIRAVTSLDNEHGIVDWEGEDYFALILQAYLDEGHGIRGWIGGARSELIEAAHIVAFGAGWMERHLGAESRMSHGVRPRAGRR